MLLHVRNETTLPIRGAVLQQFQLYAFRATARKQVKSMPGGRADEREKYAKKVCSLSCMPTATETGSISEGGSSIARIDETHDIDVFAYEVAHYERYHSITSLLHCLALSDRLAHQSGNC